MQVKKWNIFCIIYHWKSWVYFCLFFWYPVFITAHYLFLHTSNIFAMRAKNSCLFLWSLWSLMVMKYVRDFWGAQWREKWVRFNSVGAFLFVCIYLFSKYFVLHWIMNLEWIVNTLCEKIRRLTNYLYAYWWLLSIQYLKIFALTN